MDFFGIKFYASTGIVNWGAPYGNELVFKARETTGAMVVTDPWTNDIYTTEGGYTSQMPRKTPRTFAFDIQLLDARTVDKMDKIHTAISLGYRPEFLMKNGYLIGNATANTLSNNQFGFTCTIDVGELNIRNIRQAYGHEWKKPITLTIRESLTLVRPNAGDVIPVPGGLGFGN